MSYYRNTFVALLLLFVAAIAVFLAASAFRTKKHEAFTQATQAALHASNCRHAAEAERESRERGIQAYREFTKAWRAYSDVAAPSDLGNTIRASLTSLATQAGLTSEGATVAGEPRTYAVAGRAIKVQQVSLNVIGESLPAVLAWLGAVEGRYAYARVESCALSAYASHSVQLSVTLLHPVESANARPALAAAESIVSRK
ncbi:MAG TPA: hypothetical protein VFT72_19385 [Opitutaceae bacterium]|nr:hypothetical protein [Opitutaceae bacterium]